MENQQRFTVVMKRADGKSIHLRKTSRAEPHQETIYHALGIPMQLGSAQKKLCIFYATIQKNMSCQLAHQFYSI